MDVVACLVLGAGTSVLVAWGIALGTAEDDDGAPTPFSLIEPDTRAYESPAIAPVEYRKAHVGQRSAIGRRARWIGNTNSIPKGTTFVQGQSILDEWRAEVAAETLPFPDRFLSWGELDRPLNELTLRRQYAFGFPCPAMWYERSGGLGIFGSALRLHGGYEIAEKLGRTRTGLESHPAIPLRPVWMGLLLNTLVYAGAYGAIWGAWRLHRRGGDRRAGLCPHCRYDLRGVPAEGPCPECGRARLTAT